jgi:hypothetical protein
VRRWKRRAPDGLTALVALPLSAIYLEIGLPRWKLAAPRKKMWTIMGIIAPLRLKGFEND